MLLCCIQQFCLVFSFIVYLFFNMKISVVKNTLLLLSIMGLGISLYLTYVKLTSSSIVCGFGDCSKVQSSDYAMLLGVPLGVWGVVYYFAVFILIYKNLKKYLTYTLIWGVLFSVYLTMLEFFVIKAVCMWCLLSFAVIILLNVVNLVHRKL